MKKKNSAKSLELELIKQSRQASRAEAIANGTWMPRGSVHDKASRKEKRLDAKFESALKD